MNTFLSLLRPLAVGALVALALGAATGAARATQSDPQPCAGAQVTVSTAAELVKALADAKPGTSIALKPGTYQGAFVATAKGTASAPISLCGPRSAVLKGTGTSSGYILHLNGASYWTLEGFTVTNGQKGVMLDGTDHSVIRDLEVYMTGDEAIHLRSFSTSNVVMNNLIHDTGKRVAKFGEGVYVGSAQSNWASVTAGKPDASNFNTIQGNTIWNTTGEAIDIKEGTEYGVVRGNSFDGSGLGLADADSWVDVKGRLWLIEGNTGVNSGGDGFQVHEIVTGWGTSNVFRANKATLNGPGYAIAATPVRENVVECSNTVVAAAKGLANVACVNASTLPAGHGAAVPPVKDSSPTPTPEPTQPPTTTPSPTASPTQPPTTTPSPTPTPTPTPTPLPSDPCATPTIRVTTASQLASALSKAAPGDVISVAPGTYAGSFSTSADGTASKPIVMCATGAHIVGKGTSTGQGIEFSKASYWQVGGLDVSNAQTGVVIKASTSIALDRVSIHSVGDEGVEIKTGSTDISLSHVSVDEAGLRRARDGFGIVVAQAERVKASDFEVTRAPAGRCSVSSQAKDVAIS